MDDDFYVIPSPQELWGEPWEPTFTMRHSFGVADFHQGEIIDFADLDPPPRFLTSDDLRAFLRKGRRILKIRNLKRAPRSVRALRRKLEPYRWAFFPA